ncbi:MAG: hypothetical protein GXC76_05235 [Rhodanobacteraceae bacterium]|jgi:hypothetical protein|nr:hypothetical protein [Rhodanobacteraceae bacterium]
MNRRPFILLSLSLAGCASFPHGATDWHGKTAGRIEARVAYSQAALPTNGWLVETTRERATGFVSFTKRKDSYRYKKRAYFYVSDKCEPETHYLGIFQTKDGSTEFCTVNPEHGVSVEGNTVTITHSYDYCVRLDRE